MSSADAAVVPTRWEARAVERNMRRAQERAEGKQLDAARSIVMAARALLHETSGWSFTVKQVSERAGVALQTLYRHFPTKDDLLLAVLEETYVVGAAAVAKLAASVEDPLERVRTVVIARITLLKSSKDIKRNGATVREHARLAQIFPTEVERALRPQIEVIADAIRSCITAGQLDSPDVERDARLAWHLSSYIYDRLALQTDTVDSDEAAEYLWQFCYAALRRGAN